MSGMTDIPASPVSALRCTAFDGPQRLASGPYAEVAVAVKQRVRAEPDAAILIFDDASGREVDFDLRGSDADTLFHGDGHLGIRTGGEPLRAV